MPQWQGTEHGWHWFWFWWYDGDPAYGGRGHQHDGPEMLGLSREVAMVMAVVSAKEYCHHCSATYDPAQPHYKQAFT